MENASKALIIAGAILISILLITIGIVLINSGRDIAEAGTTSMKTKSMEAFNAQFTPYEGVISGVQFRKLYEVVQASNAASEIYVNLAWSLSSINDNNRYRIELLYADRDGVWGTGKKFYKGYVYFIAVTNLSL